VRSNESVFSLESIGYSRHAGVCVGTFLVLVEGHALIVELRHSVMDMSSLTSRYRGGFERFQIA
jgi:hypothetical protein